MLLCLLFDHKLNLNNAAVTPKKRETGTAIIAVNVAKKTVL